MSEALFPPPRPLSVGEVLDLSFRVYRRTFVKCLVFGGLVVVANWLPNLHAIARGQTVVQSMVRPVADVPHLLVVILASLLAVALQVAIIYRQYRMVTGQDIGGELLRTLRLLWRIVLICILYILVSFACLLPVVPAFLASGLTRYALIAVLFLPLGYVLLRLTSAFTAMVIEDTSASGSLSRSWELTGGSVLRLTAIYTVAIFLLLVMYIVIGSLTAFLYAVLGKGDVALIAAGIGVVTVAAGALASPYYSALGLAVFGDLVVRREGADLSQRISAS
jgi:membrane-anchored glycerophosphoryl diester phosphodiesterase (GDPDase)